MSQIKEHLDALLQEERDQEWAFIADESNGDTQMRLWHLRSWTLDMEGLEILACSRNIRVSVGAHMRAVEQGLITYKQAEVRLKRGPKWEQYRWNWICARHREWVTEGRLESGKFMVILKADYELSKNIRHVLAYPSLIKLIMEHRLPLTMWKLTHHLEYDVPFLSALANTKPISTDLEGLTPTSIPEELEPGEYIHVNGYFERSRHICPQVIAYRHPLTPPELKANIRKSPNQYVRFGVLLSHEITPEVLEDAAYDRGGYVRKYVVLHPLTPATALRQLATDPNAEIRRLACIHPNATIEVRAIAALVS